MTTLQDQQEDLLWQQLKSLPAFRALLRAVEARFYHHITLPDPILDIGCGDGHFAQMAFPGRAIRACVDPWWGPLQKASRTNQYEFLLQGLGDSMPFPDESFGSAFSNSVLEHIPDLPPVLTEINRVLRRGASFVITTPSHLFTDYLGGGEFFDRLKLSGLARRYRHFFNMISRHAHTDSPEKWAERLAQAGFVIEHWQYYFSREALHTLEIGHVQGLPSAILHALTGHWIIAPWDNSLKPTERWVRPYYEESPSLDGGAYLLIVARKMSRQAVPSILPPSMPLQVAAGENIRLGQPSGPPSFV
jgi:SAM-dependent methyltransferase